MTDRPWLARWWDRISLWILGLAVAFFVSGFLLVGYGVYEIHGIVGSHSSELTQIKNAANASASNAAQAKRLADQFSIDASLIKLGTAEGLADYQAICNSIPGCRLPYPSQ